MLTLVIPVYNREATIPRLLRSLEAQTVHPQRTILVDNASTDASLSILTSWAADRPDVTILTEPTPGATSARNAGLALVDTPWVMFFDSDDEMLPTHIADFTRAIADNPGADIIGRSATLVDLDGSRRTLWFTHRAPLFNHIFRTILSTIRYAVRTDLLRAAGGWDPAVSTWDDWELGVRLLSPEGKARGLHIKALPTPATAIAYYTPVSITGPSYASRLSKIETALSAARRTLPHPRHLDWLDARTMILAAQIAREGHPDVAAKLKKQTLLGTRSPLRQRLIYAHNRLFGRLTFPLVRLLFP